MSDKSEERFHPWMPRRNAVSLVVENPQNSNSEEILLVAELRCGKDVLEDKQGSAYEYGFSRLYLEIETNGCSIKPGRRIGDHSDQYKVSIKSKSVQEKTRNSSISAGLATDLKFNCSTAASPTANNGQIGVGLEAKGGGAKSDTSTEAIEIVSEEIFYPIKSNGHSGLIISTPNNTSLTSAYLQGEDLCTVIPVKDGSYEVRVQVYFQPRDIIIEHVATEAKSFLSSSISRNKLAFAKVLLAKHLNERNSDDVKHTLGKVLIAEDVHFSKN